MVLKKGKVKAHVHLTFSVPFVCNICVTEAYEYA